MATILCKTCKYIFMQVELSFSKEIKIHSDEDHDGKEFNVEVIA